MAIVGILHVALGVSDMSRSLAFYRDVLGFEVVGEIALGEASARALGVATDGLRGVLLERDGLRLELLQRVVGAVGDGPQARGSLTHFAIAVDDLASTLHSLRDRCVEVVADTLVEHAPGVASCVVCDPDGLPIALYQVPAGVASPWDRGC
jgi:catechol 2,3-dioxygenase-like lactoylglutathione lyase family enzyme